MACKQAHCEFRNPPLSVNQRTCPCKLYSQLQQASSLPSCSTKPIAEINGEYARHSLGLGASDGANVNEECTYGFRPAHWPAQKSAHVPVPDIFPVLCRHSDPPYLPRTPQFPYAQQNSQSDGVTMRDAFMAAKAPAGSKVPPFNCHQGREWEQRDQRMEPNLKGSGSYGGLSSQVILYSWFLVRCNGSSQGVEVSVGGLLNLGTAGTERFETGAIVQRLEKCRLLTCDGLKIRLAGLIDEQTTFSNGFSLDIIHAFFSGFPYTWKHLINIEVCTPTPRHPNHPMSGSCGLDGGAETSQLSFDGSKQEKRALPPSQKGVSCDHAERDSMSYHAERDSMMEPKVSQLSTDGSVQETKATSPSQQGVSCDHAGRAGIMELNIIPAVTTEAEVEKETATPQPRVVDSNFEKRALRSSQKGAPCNRRVEEASTLELNVKRSITAEGEEEKESAEGEAVKETSTITNDDPKTWPVSEGDKKIDIRSLRDHCATNLNFTSLVEQRGDNAQNTMVGVAQENPSVRQSRGNAKKRWVNRKNRRSKTQPHVGVEDASGPSCPTQIDGGPGIGSLNQSKSATENVEEHVKKNDKQDQQSWLSPRITRSMQKLSRPEASDNEAHNISAGFDVNAHCHNIKTCEEAHTPEEEQCELLAKPESDTTTPTTDCQESANKANHSKSRKTSSRDHIIPPPLPRPTVPVSQRLILAAFGLKTSRSGRLLVPPLAHWCSQGPVRAKDGGIIAISDGSKDMSNDDTGYCNFKPPAEAGLKKLQKRLREAATGCTTSRRKTSSKRRQ